MRKTILLSTLLLIYLVPAFSQCELDFSDAVSFPFTGDIVNGGSSGANESASHSFNVIDEAGAPITCNASGGVDDITFDFSIIHAIDMYGIDGVKDAYAGVTHDIVQSGTGFTGRIPLGNSGTNETTAGDARGYSIKVTFGNHLSILAEDMAINTNSINTAGNAFESTSVVFFDKSGTNYGTATYEGFYGNGSAGATNDNSCTVPAAGTPWAETGTGVYTASSTGTVNISVPCVISSGTSNPAEDNNKVIQAVSDAGLNNSDEIGGFLFTVYLEDVAASSAPGAVTTTSTSFSSTMKGLTIGAIALPVELYYFQARRSEEDKVNLSWGTLSETNNDFFAIERSNDGVNFRTIGKVEGAGEASITQSYKYEDSALVNGTYYYRLRQVDYDGTFEYSNIEIVEIDRKSPYEVFPTLFTHEVNILTSSKAISTTFDIVDVFGRLVKQGEIVNNEVNSLAVNDLSAGSYFIRLSDGFNTEVFSILKRE